MIHTNLFNEILLDPIKKGADKLYIVSGYATSAMAFHHIKKAQEINPNIYVELIIGMSVKEGIAKGNHKGFQHLMNNEFEHNFICSYLINPPATHTKLYCWMKDNVPYQGYIGSANYTQTAFLNKQKECMELSIADECYQYFQALTSDTIYCNHNEAENSVLIYNDNNNQRIEREKASFDKVLSLPENNILAGLDNVTVSLLDRNGEIHNRAGLNWGQRQGRDPNQAYIQLPPEVYKSDFFPTKSIHFTVLTDDDKTLICTRAQKNEEGAAIETPHNNSLIGEYFRNRLGLQNGAYVHKEDLINYGRNNVTFYKIDNENYYMDFSV